MSPRPVASPPLSVVEARRLALARGGLLAPRWSGLPTRAGKGARARAAALEVIRRFGYLQLDTVSVAGARSHVLVLLSRLDGFDPELGETLLRPGAGLFEYWGHEASWIPLELYPVFAFRRREFRSHPWWGDVVARHPELVRELRRRIAREGPLRALDLEGRGSRGWWDLKPARKVAAALWSSGELAVRERVGFQRTWDLTERVIPASVRKERLPRRAAFERLLLAALDGHGWATTGTLAATWRLRRCRDEVDAALKRLQRKGGIEACALENPAGRDTPGWIRPEHRELASRLSRARPDPTRAVLLSPFDPVLWDRPRVARLFGFEQVLEIFKPECQRSYGYYCLPVLAGERLVARFDLKADRKAGALRVLSVRFEGTGSRRRSSAADEAAARGALLRYAEALQLDVTGWRPAKAAQTKAAKTTKSRTGVAKTGG
jgi:uncharacterized protein YcaQ